MGLDQTLNWVGKPSKDQVERLHHKNLSEIPYPIGLSSVDLNTWGDSCYKNIKKYMIPEEVYRNECDWDLIRKDCGMPQDANICSISSSGIVFGKAINVEPTQKFDINIYDKKYWRPVLRTNWFFLEDEIYRWRNNYEVQDIFNKAFPEEWNEYKEKYEMVNCGRYKLTQSLLNKIKKVDESFAERYHDGIKNIFYSANW